jgi:hypothetical protein
MSWLQARIKLRASSFATLRNNQGTLKLLKEHEKRPMSQPNLNLTPPQ